MLFGIHQTSFLPVEALEFSELKTPLVYAFCPPIRRVLETAFEKVLRRVLRRSLAVGFNGKKGSEKGS